MDGVHILEGGMSPAAVSLALAHARVHHAILLVLAAVLGGQTCRRGEHVQLHCTLRQRCCWAGPPVLTFLALLLFEGRAGGSEKEGGAQAVGLVLGKLPWTRCWHKLLLRDCCLWGYMREVQCCSDNET